MPVVDYTALSKLVCGHNEKLEKNKEPRAASLATVTALSDEVVRTLKNMGIKVASCKPEYSRDNQATVVFTLFGRKLNPEFPASIRFQDMGQNKVCLEYNLGQKLSDTRVLQLSNPPQAALIISDMMSQIIERASALNIILTDPSEKQPRANRRSGLGWGTSPGIIASPGF